MQRKILVVFVILGVSLSLPSDKPKQFRDYEYNRKTDAFYKLHIESTYNAQAQQICEAEGAHLMIPSNKEDIAHVHGMMKRFPDLGEQVYIGDDGNKHEAADETPIIDLTDENLSREDERMRFSYQCEVLTRSGEIETTRCYFRHPFVCKVEAKDAPYDETCGVYAKGFQYFDIVKSCYRVPPVAFSWNEAYSECRAVGSHLVVLNSQAESDTVKSLLQKVPINTDAKASYFFYAGIRAERPTDGSQRVFRTVFNETLEEAGFAGWSDGEPNNHLDMEYCGTIFKNNGKYNDVDCTHPYSFICEKEVR